jgi:hypothetical protein
LLETAFHFDNMAARVEKRFEPVKVYTGSPMTSRECGDS